jgi:hypothetical protein
MATPDGTSANQNDESNSNSKSGGSDGGGAAGERHECQPERRAHQ